MIQCLVKGVGSESMVLQGSFFQLEDGLFIIFMMVFIFGIFLF